MCLTQPVSYFSVYYLLFEAWYSVCRYDIGPSHFDDLSSWNTIEWSNLNKLKNMHMTMAIMDNE